MANVYLRFEGGKVIADLPMVCMKCGAPATVRKSKVFIRIPPSKEPVAHFLVHFLPVVGVVLVAFVFKRYYLETPFCDNHKNYWRKYPLMMWLWVLGMVAFNAACMIATAAALAANNMEPDVVRVLAMLVGFAVAVPELIVLLVILVMNRTIRITEFTSHHLCVSEVSPEFAAAVEDLEVVQQVKETHST